MTTIPYLQAGDKIGILSTARKISIQELENAMNIFQSWGLEVVLGKTINASLNQFAGSDELKIQDFNDMLADDSIKAIICARGGYGTVRIIDSINVELFKSQAKWIVGFSDVTTLHAHIHQQSDLQSIHGIMPINFPIKDEENTATQTLKKLLFGETTKYQFPSHKLNKKGNCKGQLVGGNLSIIYSLLGSPSSYNTDGKILFLEDLDEYLYHIDRMMMNLKRNGLLNNLSGLLIGGMSDMNDNAIPFGKTALEIIHEHTKDMHYPISFNLPSGHIEDNFALKIGGEYHLEVGENESLLTLLS